MNETVGSNVYTKLGVRRVVNARGNSTVVGGSAPAAEVRQSMDEANASYVEMRELLERSGEYLAEILGVEAAYITSGCAAALALSAAGCMTGTDPEKTGQLPDTSGLKNEVVIQRTQRYQYQRSYTMTGAKLIEAGEEDGCTIEQLASAIGPNTAAVAYLLRPDWDSSVVTLDETVSEAHARDVPVIVDAASQIYPLDYFRRTAQSADLVCFGAKYFGAPHSTGFVCGDAGRVRAAAANGFIAFETDGGRAFSRPMKVDRQEVVGVVTALEAWFSMDHEERLIGIESKATALERGLRGLPNAQAEVVHGNTLSGAIVNLVLNKDALAKTAQQVADELYAGNPRVRVGVDGDDTIYLQVYTLNEGEERIVSERLWEVLGR